MLDNMRFLHSSGYVNHAHEYSSVASGWPGGGADSLDFRILKEKLKEPCKT